MNYNNFCIIMAGGVGRRLWPVSRQYRPKQFIDFFGTGQTLLQLTYQRVARFIPASNIYVCTARNYLDLTREQLPQLTDEQILLEPVQLSTAPAAARASWHIARRAPNANILLTPADQLITDEQAYADQLQDALDYVATHPDFLAIGINATNPNTAYGYIQRGLEIGKRLYRVKSFTEKPPLQYAQTFVQSREFVWNTGIFLWNVATMQHVLQELLPAAANTDIIISNQDEEQRLIDATYPAAQRFSIDTFILTRSDNRGKPYIDSLAVQQCTFGWCDVGSWPVMSEVLPHTADGNATIGSRRVSFQGTRHTIVALPEGQAAIVRGLDGYVVALQDDVLLITPNDDPTRPRTFATELQMQYGEQYL